LEETLSIILAAGRGSRMKGYEGNKVLLPLIPKASIYQGDHPMILEVLKNLPPGPKAVVVHHKKEEVMSALAPLGVHFVFQPELNGTGGAVLAAKDLICRINPSRIIITLGDVPLVKKTTYQDLLFTLSSYDLSVLGFQPKDKKEFGIILVEGDAVRGIVEWKYWKNWPVSEIKRHNICNAGIYAMKTHPLLELIDELKIRPHVVQKILNGKSITFHEYFITDLIEFANERGYKVGLKVAKDEFEAMGVDDPESLRVVQDYFFKASAGFDSSA
jgi:bifunctional N-acetylglucosamine-1-phosphate-uridyltransferase/glucosamine-1-phosphate-acetyltransferase GlmU-like protein